MALKLAEIVQQNETDDELAARGKHELRGTEAPRLRERGQAESERAALAGARGDEEGRGDRARGGEQKDAERDRRARCAACAGCGNGSADSANPCEIRQVRNGDVRTMMRQKVWTK